MYFTPHCNVIVKYKVYAGMPNPDKHVVQNPSRSQNPGGQESTSIYKCKAVPENSFPAYSLQMSDIRGSRSFLMMIVHKLFSVVKSHILVYDRVWYRSS